MISVKAGSKRAAPPPRKPSPPRQNAPEEKTFQSKLEEIKKMRSMGGHAAPAPQPERGSLAEPIVPKQVKTVTGVKTFLKSFGDWIEVVSKSGKVYFYNKKTQQNQWKKPQEWVDEERRLNPPLPDVEPEKPPPPPVIEPAESSSAPKVKMKLKTKKKVTKRLKKESKLPLAYQKNPLKSLDDSSEEEADTKEKLTVENAFEDPEDGSESSKLAKLDKKDEIGHIDIKLPKEEQKSEEPKSEEPTKSEDKKPVDKKEKPVVNVVGHERANNLVKGSAAQLAFSCISNVPEATAIYGDFVGALNTSETGNPTYFTEYNLPCCLRRCKFPKEQDVLHELKINKLKKRNFHPPSIIPGLDPNLAHLAEQAEMEQFYIELKNYNHHDRLLTSRMEGTLVYKIPDDVWDRFFHKFQIKIFSGLYLECKPSGYSHNDELIYSRTGKVCGYKTFPEDEARCQAVLQAWNKSHCLCIYANKVFRVERDDRKWDSDLREIRRFLEKNGF